MSMNPTVELENTQQALFALDQLKKAYEAELQHQNGVTQSPNDRVISQNINLLNSILSKGYAKSDALAKKVYAQAHKDEKHTWKQTFDSVDGNRYEYTYTEDIGGPRFRQANANVQKADEDLRQLGRANNIDLASFFRSFNPQNNLLSSEQLQSASEEFRVHYKTSFLEREERPMDFWMDIPYYFELKSLSSLKNQMMKVLESKREKLTVIKLSNRENWENDSSHQSDIDFYSSYYTRLCYPSEAVKTFINIMESYYADYKEILAGCNCCSMGIPMEVCMGLIITAACAGFGVPIYFGTEGTSFWEVVFFLGIPAYWLGFVVAALRWKEQSKECIKLLDQSEADLDQKLNEIAPRLGLPYEEMEVAMQNQVPSTIHHENDLDENAPLLVI